MSLRAPTHLYQHQANVRTTPPAVEPVSLSDVKAHLRIDHAADDALLTTMIGEAREEIEQASGMAMISQGWRLTVDRWPVGRDEWWDGVREGSIRELYGPDSATRLKLPVYPLISVTGVTVYDTAGNATSVNVASTFDVDTQSRPGRLALKFSQTWPVALRPTNAIQVEYTAGFGTVAGAVPGPLKRAIKAMVGHLYSHRGDGCDPTDAYHASGAAMIMGEYRVKRI